MSRCNVSSLSKRKILSSQSCDIRKKDIKTYYEDKVIHHKRNRKSSKWLPRKNTIIAEGKFPQDYNGCYCLRFSPDEENFAATFGTGCVQVRSSEDCGVISVLKPAAEKEAAMTVIRFQPNDASILYSANLSGNIYMLKKKPLSCALFAQENLNEINSIDINMGCDYLVSAGKDAIVRIYDLHTKKPVLNLGNDRHEVNSRHHKMRIFAVKCHPDHNDVFFTGGWDNCLKVWDVRMKDGPVKSINGPHICGDAIDVKDALVLTGSWTISDSLQIYDFRKGELLETIRPVNKQESIDGEFYYTCQFYKGASTSDIIFAGGSGTGAVDVIQRSTNKLKCRFKTNKTILSLDTKSNGLIFGGMYNAIKSAFIPTFS